MGRLSRIVSGRRSVYVVLAVWLARRRRTRPVRRPLRAGAEERRRELPPRRRRVGRGPERRQAVPAGRRDGRERRLPRPGRPRRRPTGRRSRRSPKRSPRRASRASSGPRSPVLSEDGTAALVTVPILADNDIDRIVAAVDEIRTVIDRTAPSSLEAHVTGPGGLLGRREQGLRRHQLDAAVRDGPARLRPARSHLPQPDLLVPAAPLRALRRERRARARLPAGRGGRRHQRPGRRPPARARVRRRDGLRPAPDRALPGGAAARRGQARGDADRRPPGRPGDRRVGRHRRRGAPLSLVRAAEHDRGPRPGRRHGRRRRSDARC